MSRVEKALRAHRVADEFHAEMQSAQYPRRAFAELGRECAEIVLREHLRAMTQEEFSQYAALVRK